MAGEVGKVSSAGKGFFNESGELKSKEQIQKEAGTSTKRVESEQEESSSSEQIGRVRSGLSSAKDRFVKQTNEVLSAANENEALLKSARKQINKEIDTAQELKKAIKQGDTDKADKKRQELEALRLERDKLAEDVSHTNSEQSDKRVKNISFGNQQKGLVRVEKVEFEKSKSSSLDNVDDVDAFIEGRKSEKASVKSQIQDIKSTKKQVEGFVSETKEELSSIESDSIKSIGQAEERANSIAAQITRGGAQTSLVHNLNDSVVKALLA